MAVLVAVALLGFASSAIGLWLGPETLCPAPYTAEANRYCGFTWWFVLTPPIVALAGALAGFLGPSWKRLGAGLAGILLGNLLGSSLAYALAAARGIGSAVFSNPLPPPLEEIPSSLLLAVFPCGVVFVIGYGLAGAVLWLLRRFP